MSQPCSSGRPHIGEDLSITSWPWWGGEKKKNKTGFEKEGRIEVGRVRKQEVSMIKTQNFQIINKKRSAANLISSHVSSLHIPALPL